MSDSFKWKPRGTRRRFGPVTETVEITLDKITVSYSDPELCLTPELMAKLQAYWATRIEEMAHRLLTGDLVPEREQSTLTAGTYAAMFPSGVSRRRDPFAPVFHGPKFVHEYRTSPDPSEASQEAVQQASPVPAATTPLKPE